ncbi:MAG TPA: alkaline phosphatase family protein [Planctomycetaceae bacterium]|nr:alkaline phosphatase family protein [Planctomycetaceae bacterium]
MAAARPLMVINVVGLTPVMIGSRTPNLQRLANSGFQRPLQTVLPAVTCSVQATLLTGLLPAQHGIVGNGWYFRELAEVGFWKQSNHLIQGEKLYQTAAMRDPAHRTAKMFWWYNMYADTAWSVTPRPSYPADGRKIPDLYSEPAVLRDELQEQLGRFPLFNFWGPTADIRSTAWIADASCQLFRREHPSLMLVYLPHLDYNLQRVGPDGAGIDEDIRLVDAEAGKLIDVARECDAEVVVLSEYGITQVNQPIHINRILRQAGYLRVRREPLGWETLDCGASRAFAVSDHQVAHVYVKRPQDVGAVQRLLEGVAGIERVLDADGLRQNGLQHERSGELVCVSARNAWFTYYFWNDDSLAPDYARTVDIHRKPGYDPAELLVNPDLKFPRLVVAARLLRKMLGFRYYMDVIGLQAEVVRGSHGRLPDAGREATDGPVFLSSSRAIERDRVHALDVRDLLLQLQFG